MVLLLRHCWARQVERDAQALDEKLIVGQLRPARGTGLSDQSFKFFGVDLKFTHCGKLPAVIRK
ncbi:hypothetical protein [Mesorhizobium sanjuanii]|uniref:hypothetical protein n=1 Tax=Mesorhizobium sanjuanii TaxID=2037900 RepID=UPI0013FD488B|nr:hypothetical protein [Mesorhizobium sanjuanii]